MIKRILFNNKNTHVTLCLSSKSGPITTAASAEHEGDRRTFFHKYAQRVESTSPILTYNCKQTIVKKNQHTIVNRKKEHKELCTGF